MTNDIQFYWTLIKKRMPVMMVIFVLCAGIGVGLAMTMPPRYQANAAMLVEGAQLPDTLIESTVQSEAALALQGIQLRLLTRANLIDIATKYRLFRAEGLSPDEIVETMRGNTTIKITSGRDKATIMNITYEAGNPQAAANVVNEFVTLVLEADADRRTTSSGQTLAFFELQVERLAQILAERRADIVAFKEENNDALPDGLNFRLSRQSQLQERLNFAARDRTSLIEQRNRLVAVGDANGVGNGRMTPLEAEIARLETELRSKLGIFEADSPTIKFLQAQLERLKSTDPITASGTTVETEDDNGAGTLFELQIAEIDSQIDALDEETKRINEELETLNDAIERTPRVAIKLDGMEREYEATQSEYQEAVRDRSTARQGVDVESAAKGERVVLIENADVPSEPSSPNRVLIAGGGLFMGSAIAGVFFVLTELLNSAIRRPIDLTKGLGVQPLAVIPYMEEASVRRRRRILKIAFLIFVIVSIPFGLWSIHTHYLPLDLVLEMVLEKAGL